MQLKNRKNLVLSCAGVLTLTTTKFQDTEGNEVLLSILDRDVITAIFSLVDQNDKASAPQQVLDRLGEFTRW
jgi:hypothetical protein